MARLGMDSTFLAYDSCRALGSLLASGYRDIDAMTVLLSRGPTGGLRPGGPEVVASASPRRWTDAYLSAFYGSGDQAGAVGPIVDRLSADRATTLLESRVGGETAGVLAIFRTPGIAGVYCVGTVPEYRRQGVASALLASAREVAQREKRSLILQTLTSDGALRFYLDRGFEPLYAKRVLERKLK